MEHARSGDGTAIAFDRLGAGPAVVLVGGATTTRAENAALAEELSRDFTVLNYDRRGRGDSGDTPPYAVAREVDDLAAVIAAAGGPAHVYGVSSGGALALEAAAAGVPMRRIAVYEVPYDMAGGAQERHRAYTERIGELLAQGRRGDAFAAFMLMAGASESDVEGARRSPVWARCEEVAPTIAYDAAVMGDNRPPVDRFVRIDRPVLVATGGASPDSFVGGGGDFFPAAADVLVACLPHGERATVPGQTHAVDPKVLAPLLAAFFTGKRPT